VLFGYEVKSIRLLKNIQLGTSFVSVNKNSVWAHDVYIQVLHFTGRSSSKRRIKLLLRKNEILQLCNFQTLVRKSRILIHKIYWDNNLIKVRLVVGKDLAVYHKKKFN
jgi:tmRNA-binding protein